MVIGLNSLEGNVGYSKPEREWERVKQVVFPKKLFIIFHWFDQLA